MSSTVLSGLVLDATEDELRELISIIRALDDDDDARDLRDWLMSWARGQWATIVDSPASRAFGPATPARVIEYFSAYLDGER